MDVLDMSFDELYHSQIRKPSEHALLINKFCPMFRFHEDEQFMPCSIEWYTSKCDLIDNVTGKLNMSAPSPEFLAVLNQRDYVLCFDPSFTNGQPFLNETPIYVAVFEDLHEDIIYLQYCLLFAYNGPSKLFAKCKFVNSCGCEAGAHYGELEHVTIKVKKSTQEMISVYFGAHRRYDGCWRDARKVEKTITNNPIVYVALGSHACYPQAKKYTRLCGLTCDETSQSGKTWHPIPQLINDNTNWNEFMGYLGQPNENHVPKMHEWYHGNDPKFSANWFTRLFCCCI